MINPNSADFSAFPSNYREVEGEIMPNYTPGNGNQPRRPKLDADTSIDGETLADMSSYEGEIPPAEVAVDVRSLIAGMKQGLKTNSGRDSQVREAASPTTVRSVKPFKQ